MDKLSRKEKREKLLQRNKERSERQSGARPHVLDLTGYDDVEFYELIVGDNYLDILTYEVSSENHPDMPVGEDDYKLEVWVHDNIGVKNEQVVCLRKTYNQKCPICEVLQEKLDSGIEWADKQLSPLKPKIRCYYNVIDMSNKGTDKILILETSGAEKWFDDLLSKEAKQGEEIITFYDIEDGRTVKCRCAEDTFNKKTFARPERIDFKPREPYNESIYDEVYPLDAMLKVPTYQEVANKFLELGEEKPSDTGRRRTREEEPTADKKEEEPLARSRRRTTEEPKQEPDSGRSRRRSAQAEEKKEEEPVPANSCPYDHIMGIDYNKHDSCKDCDNDTFEKCADEKDKIDAAEPKEEKKNTRSRRRK